MANRKDLIKKYQDIMKSHEVHLAKNNRSYGMYQSFNNQVAMDMMSREIGRNRGAITLCENIISDLERLTV